MNKGGDDDFDFFEARAPLRSPMDDLCDEMSSMNRTGSRIEKEVTRWNVASQERHEELRQTLKWTVVDRLSSMVQTLEIIQWVLVFIAAMLAYIAYHLK